MDNVVDVERQLQEVEDQFQLDEISREEAEERKKLIRSTAEAGTQQVGRVTRAGAEQLRENMRMERENMKDGAEKIEGTMVEIETKFLEFYRIMGRNPKEISAHTEWMNKMKKEVTDQLAKMTDALTAVEGQNNEGVVAIRKMNGLMEFVGVAEVDQLIVEWTRLKNKNEELTEHKNGLVEMITRVEQAEDVESLPKLIEKLAEERGRIEGERVEWKNKSDELTKLELQLAKLKKESEEKIGVYEKKIEELEEQERKRKEQEGDTGHCARCVAKDEKVGGKLKDRKMEQKDGVGSLEVMRQQLATFQSPKPLSVNGQESLPRRRTSRSRSTRTRRSRSRSERGTSKHSSRKDGSSDESSTDGSDSDSSDGESVDSSASSKKMVESSTKMRTVMASKLPRMDKYKGSKEEWERFYDGFMIRFKCLDDDMAIAMLAETLTGPAFETFKDIPRKVKESGLKQVMKWLKKRLSEETPFEIIENEKKLRKIVVQGKKISSVCDELERLTRKMYQDKKMKEETRRYQLVLLYERKDQHERLLEMFAKGDSYKKMKAKLLQMEYMKEQMYGLKKSEPSRHESRSIADIICLNCNRKGHMKKDCRTKPFERRSGFTEIKTCDHCKKPGHLKAACYLLNGYPGGSRPQFNPGVQEFKPSSGGQRTTGMILDRSTKGGMNMIQGEMNEDDREKFFVIKKSREVKGRINGEERSVLLDTGAEASLIEEGLLNGMEGVVVKENDKTVLMDANKKTIELCGKTVLDVELEIGKRAKIGFYVTRSRVGVIVGGVGLDAIGVELRAIGEKDQQENEVMEDKIVEEEEGNLEEAGDAAVLRTCVIPKGEMGFVWVNGDPTRVVILESMTDGVVEGIAVKESCVMVPVVNNTDEEMTLEKHHSIGRWKVCTDTVSEGATIKKIEERDHTEETGRWAKIAEKMKKNHVEGMDEEVVQLLKEHQNVFAVRDDELGELKEYECGIELLEEIPVKQKPRVVPFAIREQLRLLIEKMKSQGVIERSSSPWSSPIVIVKKKNGTIRLCVDYRKVNLRIKHDAHPLPHLESTIQSLAGKRWFTTIDLASGFWQIRLSDQAKEVTAFSCLGEHFQFRVLPFGLATSPCMFQRAMMEMLKEEMDKEGEHRRVYCYIDDLLIATETREEQLETLKWVLQRMEDKGVLINPEKCKFLSDNVQYLGHVITKDGVEMEEEKVQAVREFPRPMNASDLRQFLGLVNWHRRFIRGFCEIAAPLHTLTSGKDRWLWTAEHEKAFIGVKQAVTTAPCLIQPDFAKAVSGERPFHITTDASCKGIGGVLTQADDDGNQRPIAFFSRSLRGAEKNYSIVDAEALGIYECVRKWTGIVYGTRVIVKTDHAPLVSMFKRNNVAPRILRWAAELMPYNLQIEYVKGKENYIADALSRAPLELEGEPVTIGEDVIINRMEAMDIGREDGDGVRVEDDKETEARVRSVRTRAMVEKSNEDEVERERDRKEEEWRIDQGKDDWVEMVKKGVIEVEKGIKDGSEKVEMPSSSLNLSWADMEVHHGLLYVKGRDHQRLLYVPLNRRKNLIKEMHESVLLGHTGAKKLLQLLKREFIWGSMEKEVMETVQKCQKCRICNARKKYVPPLQPKITKEPLEMVAVDLLDLGKSKEGNRYVLVVIDLFSKFGGAYPIRDKKAVTVAQVFLNRWVLENVRVPQSLLNDNGGEFVNEIMEEIVRLWKIDRHFTLPYHSRANGGVERLNRTLTDIMRRMPSSPEEWEDALPYALYVYNNTPHKSTGETPAFLMNGRDERLPGGEPTKLNENYVVDKDDYKTGMQILMRKTIEEVNMRMEGERKKMKETYDRKFKFNKGEEPKIGDRVYIKKELIGVKNPKLEVEWEGPYRVVDRGTTTATVKRISDGKERVVQLDRIRRVPGEDTEDDEVEGMIRIVDQPVEEESVNDECFRRYVIKDDDALNWKSPCNKCGVKKLVQKWAKCPEEWRDMEIRTPYDMVLVMAMLREEGESANSLFRAQWMEDKKMEKIEEADVIGGLTRGLCDHAIPLIKLGSGKLATFTLPKDVPPRLEDAYRKVLREDTASIPRDGVIIMHSSMATRVNLQEHGDEKQWRWRFEDHSKMVDAVLEGIKEDSRHFVVMMSHDISTERAKEIINLINSSVVRGSQRVLFMKPLWDTNRSYETPHPIEAHYYDWQPGLKEGVTLLPDTSRYNTRDMSIEKLHLIRKMERRDYEAGFSSIFVNKKWNINNNVPRPCYICNKRHGGKECPEKATMFQGLSEEDKKKKEHGSRGDEKKEEKKSKEKEHPSRKRRSGGSDRDGDASGWKGRGDVREKDEREKKRRFDGRKY